MSATPDSPINGGGVSPEDHAHPTFRKRLEARKERSLHHVANAAKKRDRLVELALAYQVGSILCFVRTVKDAVESNKLPKRQMELARKRRKEVLDE